ncbi:MAG: aldehyde dehydrogenase family protein, partial [Solirubrobacterales bacterium]
MATATAKKTKVLELKNMIGGKFTDAAEGETEDILNPATGEVIAHAPLSTEKDVDKAVKAARKAFETWQNTTPAERSALLLKLADAFEERAEEITDLETMDAGKPRAAMFEEEIPPMVDQLRFFAGAARTMEGRAAGEYMEGHTSFIRREPIGVCGQITPWNYPLMMAVWKIGPALATGNTLVLKPAETTPVTTLKVLAETCAEIFPPGVANFIAGHGEPAGASLV